jgi:hypothetical protein
MRELRFLLIIPYYVVSSFVTMAVIAPGADVVQHSKSVHFIFVYIICLWCNSLPVECLHHICLFKFHGFYKNIKLQVLKVCMFRCKIF